MYGLPGETLASWKEDLKQALALHPEHISAYHLIYEEGTTLWQLREQHKLEEADEDLSVSSVQIDNKNEEEQKTAISKQMDSGRINLKSLLPGMKNCELAISENGKAILRVNNGELRMSRELTTAELSRLSATLNNNTLTEEAKRIRVTGMLNTVILSEAASQNFEHWSTISALAE